MASDKAFPSVEDIDVPRLRAAMMTLGLTQAETARRLGTSQATVSKILARKQRPRAALLAAVERLCEPVVLDGADDLMRRASGMARRSPAFREFLAAALKFANDGE
ncbi:hypothetical protein ASG51_14555 [Methylobacterium sp. Leaf465]|nr:hypothetical protein ASG51_14555 [Methylobacterium sp. Leaf465]